MTLSITTLCHHSKCSYIVLRVILCYAECHFADCQYVECWYSDCHDTPCISIFLYLLIIIIFN